VSATKQLGPTDAGVIEHRREAYDVGRRGFFVCRARCSSGCVGFDSPAPGDEVRREEGSADRDEGHSARAGKSSMQTRDERPVSRRTRAREKRPDRQVVVRPRRARRRRGDRGAGSCTCSTTSSEGGPRKSTIEDGYAGESAPRWSSFGSKRPRRPTKPPTQEAESRGRPPQGTESLPRTAWGERGIASPGSPLPSPLRPYAHPSGGRDSVT